MLCCGGGSVGAGKTWRGGSREEEGKGSTNSRSLLFGITNERVINIENK